LKNQYGGPVKYRYMLASENIPENSLAPYKGEIILLSNFFPVPKFK